MKAKEAKEYGFIDGAIMNPLKALQPLPAAVEGKDRDSIWTWDYCLVLNNNDLLGCPV